MRLFGSWVAVGAVLAATGGCPANESDASPQVMELQPFASDSVPLSSLFDIAIVSEDVACTTNSFESQIYCVDRDGGASAFGREGEGPGEFKGLVGIERGSGGQVVAMDYGAARMTSFEVDGTLVSEVDLPPIFQPLQFRDGRVFGIKLGMLDFSSTESLPNFVPMAADANSGEVLWQRTDLAGIVGRECFTGAVGILTPNGGLVFEVCNRDLAFFAQSDAKVASVMTSPGYVESLPGDRDVDEQREAITDVHSRNMMSTEAVEASIAEFRKKPKDWILKPGPFSFDGQDRLWVATTLDRDTFSYFDIWDGTEYIGMVRVRDRLLGFDIFGSILVTLVERRFDSAGIPEWGIDWYDLAGTGW